MQVSVEKTSNLGRRLVIEVPAEQVRNEEKLRLKDLSKNMRVDGFRAGKVPADFIQKKYADQLRHEAVSKVLETSLGIALKEQNLRPANRPNVEDLKDDKGQNLKYTVTFEVYPEIILKDFSAVVLTKDVAEITEEDIDSGVEKLQSQFARWVDVTDRAAQSGDKVTIDFVGLLDGTPFENGSAENFDLELGSKQLIAGFEDGLIGTNIGDDRTLDLTFPAEYGASHLAGKAVQFNVTVKRIQSKVSAVVDGDFAARIGIEDKDVSKVRAKIRDNMIKYMGDVVQNKLREQVLEKLYEVNPFELPDSLVAQEKHNLMHEGHGKDVDCEHAHGKDLSPAEDAELSAKATKRVSIGLLLNEIIAKNNLQPDQDRLLAKIKAMSVMYGSNADLIQKMYYESKELRENLQNMVLTDQAADLIVAGATIKEQQSTFYGIVNAKME